MNTEMEISVMELKQPNGPSLPNKRQQAQSKKEEAMRTKLNLVAIVVSVMLVTLAWTLPVLAGTNLGKGNYGADPASPDTDNITDSATITITSSALTVVKQAYTTTGTLIASGSSVPKGSTIKFLIYVKNTTDVAVNDLRLTDQLDETATGFTLISVAGSSTKRALATTPDTNTDAQIFTAADTGASLTDVVGAPDDILSWTDTGASPAGLDKLTVGPVTGQVNTAVNMAAHTTFAIIYSVTVK